MNTNPQILEGQLEGKKIPLAETGQGEVYVEKIPLTKQDPVVGVFRPRHNSRNRSAGFQPKRQRRFRQMAGNVSVNVCTSLGQ
jgi:hypothetical protein